MKTIEEFNARILNKGNQLASDVCKSIKAISLNVPQLRAGNRPSEDDLSRPWKLSGAALLAVGTIGAIASGSKWTYFIGALGLASLYVGITKNNSNQTQREHAYSNVNYDEEKAFIIDKVNTILDATKKEWDQFMDSVKNDLQTTIKTSTLSEEKKEEYLSYSYYPETLPLSTLGLIDKLDSITDSIGFTSQVLDKKEEFAKEVALCIINTASAQIKSYNKINL